MIGKYLSLLKNTFVKGGIIFALTNFTVGILNYFFNVFVGRSLGPVGFGEIITLNSYLFILSAPLITVTAIVIKKIGSASKNRYGMARSIENWLILKFKRWWFLLLPLIFIAPLLPNLTNLSPSIAYSLIVIGLLTIISAFYNSALQGLHWFTAFALILIISTSIKLTGGFIVLFGPRYVNIVVLFILLASVFRTFSSVITFRIKTKNVKLGDNTLLMDKRIVDLLKDHYIWITTISLFSITMLNNIDVIFVKKYFEPYEAGLYGSWSLFAKIIYFTLAPVLSISYMYFSDKTTSKQHLNVLLKIFFALMGISGIGVFGYYIFGSLIIDALFGEQYLAVVPLITFAGLSGMLYVSLTLLNSYFIAYKSKLALLLPSGLFFYIVSLYLMGNTIEKVININIAFSATILCVYGFAVLFTKSKEFKKNLLKIVR